MTDSALLDPPPLSTDPQADRAGAGACAPAPAAELPSEIAELAAGFIHEIKNHIGTLSLNLQLLTEDLETAETPRERRAHERVGRLSGQCSKLVDLSNNFLRFARLRELHAKPVPLDQVVSRVIEFLGPTAQERNVEIEWFPGPDLPDVCLDCDLFEQALLNLMLNAEQAMPDGGKLTLTGRYEGGTVLLDVIDTGTGIEPAALAKLFRPFHTTKPDGNGLGLATTRKIVTAHGGTIGVQSEPGRGTKFTIALPVTTATGA